MSNKNEFSLVGSNIHIPVDYLYIAYLIMFWEGVGNLFPWNAFITASTYYAERFCGTSFESNFENFFSITYTLSQTVGLVLSVIYQNKISLTNKIIWPLLCYSIIFAMTTVLVAVQDIDPNLLFWVTLLSSCLCGCCGAILSAGLFGLAAMFPPMYTGAMMNGQAVAGLVVAVSGLLTLLASSDSSECDDDDDDDDGDDDEDECKQTISYSALAYFIIATFILLSCALAFLYLGQLSFTKYHISRMQGEDEIGASSSNPLLHNDDDEQDDEDMGNFGETGADADRSMGESADSTAEENRRRVSSANLSVIDANRNSSASTSDAAMAARQQKRDPSSGAGAGGSTGDDYDRRTDFRRLDSAKATPLAPNKIWRVYSLIMTPSVSVFLVFSVTIGLFPSLIVLLESTNKCGSGGRFSNDLFVPFFFVLFNLFDLLGRIPAGLFPPLFTAQNVWIPAVARFIFIPMFLLCNVSGSQLPVVFNHDAFPIIFMVLLAFTNGYVASTCMILGSHAAPPKDAPIAGTMMILSLTLGLFMGASLSFPIVYISQGRV